MLYGKEQIVETDVLVIGGGIAGCFAAIKAKEQGVDVALVDKGYTGKSGQTPCCNVTSVYIPERDDLKVWMDHAHRSTDYVDNPEWIELTFRESLALWKDYCDYGIQVFKWDSQGNVFVSSPLKDDGEMLTQGGGGTFSPRINFRYPIRQNAEVLRKQCVKSGIKMMDKIMITDLIKQEEKIVGAIGIGVGTDDYEVYIFKAKAIVMAAGAAGLKADGIRCFSTGDADAMAYRVGCEITGKEWNEGHPARADFPTWPWSALDRDRMSLFKGFYIPRGTPQYLDAYGQPIQHVPGKPQFTVELHAVHEGRAPLFKNVYAGGPEFFVMNHSPKDLPRKKVDEIAAKKGYVRMTGFRALGQSSHMADGIWPVDTNGASQIEGLYAAGDCLGGVGGSCYATPPGGLTTAFSGTSGVRAGIAAAKFARGTKLEKLDEQEVTRLKTVTGTPMERKGGFTPEWATQVIQNTMFPYWVLYYKKADRMQTALNQIEFIRDNIIPKLTASDPHELRLAHETKSMILNAEMKLRASLLRTESRGSHYREDYPRRDDPNWLAWIKLKDDNGEMKLTKVPIPEKWWPDLSKSYDERYSYRYPGDDQK